MLARRGRIVAYAVPAAALALAGWALAATGSLTPRGCVDDVASGPDTCAKSTGGLSDAYNLTMSPDGRSVYVTGLDDDAVTWLKRNRKTGALTPRDCVNDNDTGPAECSKTTNGLGAVRSAAVSSDGKFVYTASEGDDAVNTFRRNTTTGALTPRGCIEDNDTGIDGCTKTTNGLTGASAVAISRDGRSVYATSLFDSAIVRFKRNRTTGKLTPRGCIDDNSGSDTCAKSIPSLNGPERVLVSGDGKNVYASSNSDHAIVTFRRNRSTGALKPRGCIADNDSGPAACSKQASGLDGAQGIALTRDGRTLYSASDSDYAVAVFKRNTRTGALTPKGCVDDNDSGADHCAKSTNGLSGAYTVAVSQDEKSVYAVSESGDSAIVTFRRKPSGALVPRGCIDDNDSGGDHCARSTNGLDSAGGVVVSPDGRSVYVSSQGDDAVVRFSRQR